MTRSISSDSKKENIKEALNEFVDIVGNEEVAIAIFGEDFLKE